MVISHGFYVLRKELHYSRVLFWYIYLQNSRCESPLKRCEFTAGDYNWNLKSLCQKVIYDLLEDFDINGTHTGRFIMFSVITNIYNKKTKGPTLMELFTATGKLEKFFLTTRNVRCVHHGWHGTHRYDIQVVTTHVSVCVATDWIVCRVTPGAHIENL